MHLHRVLTCFACLRVLPLWGFRCLLAIVSPYKPWTRGPVRAHPWPYEFAMTCGLGLHTHFRAGLCLRLALSHSTVLLHHSLNLRDMVSPQKAVTRVSHWEWISLPFCLLRQAWIWIQFLTSLTSGAFLPLLVPAPHWVLLCVWGPHHNMLGGWAPPLDQAVCWCLAGSLLLMGQGTHPSNKIGEKKKKTHCLCNHGSKSPKNVEISSWDMGHCGSLAGSNILLCQHILSGLVSKGWALRTKGSHLTYPCKQLQKQKAGSNPYMVTCNPIGYFTLMVHDLPPPPVLYDFLHIWIS
jgi:hypothetical protein